MTQEEFNRNDSFREKFDSLGFNTVPILQERKHPPFDWDEYKTKKYDGPIGPKQNLGAILGKISGNKIVLDFDDKELGKIAFTKWNNKTRIHKSMNGGYHVFFETDESPPKNIQLNNKEGKHVADLKAEGGIIILPPSRIKDGNPYSIISDVPIMKITLKELDTILKDPIFGFSKNQTKKSIEDLRKSVNEGNRNQNLFDYLVALRIENPNLNEADLLDFAILKNNRNSEPLDKREVENTVKSTSDYDLGPAQEKKQKEKILTEKIESNAKELYEFAKKKIKKTIVSKSDSNQIFAKIQNNNHIETIDLNTGKAKSWLLFNFKQETKKLYASEAYKNALEAIRADALFDGSDRETIYNRIAQTDDTIYYDLCSSSWEFVKITKSDIEIIPYDETIPTFIRKQAMNEQVKPVFESRDALEELVNLLQIPDEDRVIFKVHLICFFFEKHQTPMEVTQGEHGSRKTTITKTIKGIVDPTVSNIGSMPTRKDDLPQNFQNNYLVVFDNVSELKQSVSDSICRAITGDQIPKRQLYTDADDYIFQYKRKITLNGISPRIESPDLIDRVISYDITQIPDEKRLTEEEFNEKINELKPNILGQIFTILSKTLKNYNEIGKSIKPFSRMGEFEKYGETISRILGYKENEFLDRYKEKWQLGTTTNIDAWPIIGLIQSMMENQKDFADTIANLHKQLKSDAKEQQIEVRGKESGFPVRTNTLSHQLKQLTPTFRRLGYQIKIKQYYLRDGKFPKGSKVVYITNDNFAESESKKDVKGDIKSQQFMNIFKLLEGDLRIPVKRENLIEELIKSGRFTESDANLYFDKLFEEKFFYESQSGYYNSPQKSFQSIN